MESIILIDESNHEKRWGNIGSLGCPPLLSAEGLRNCCVLGAINLVYFARARTEERHLSRDATYVAYALWMDEHGITCHLSEWLPFIRYRPPSGERRVSSGGSKSVAPVLSGPDLL